MTYDQLYEHIVHYVAQPLDDKRKIGRAHV